MEENVNKNNINKLFNKNDYSSNNKKKDEKLLGFSSCEKDSVLQRQELLINPLHSSYKKNEETTIKNDLILCSVPQISTNITLNPAFAAASANKNKNN